MRKAARAYCHIGVDTTRVASTPEYFQHVSERKCPSGWWIFPGIVLGCIEAMAIIGWIVA